MVTLIKGRPSESFQIRTVIHSDSKSGTILKLLYVVKVHVNNCVLSVVNKGISC